MLDAFSSREAGVAMIFEVLFIAFPVALGALLSQRRGWALRVWVALEALLVLVAVFLLKQPFLAAAATTLLLSGTGFCAGLLFASLSLSLRRFGLPALAFVCGALLTGSVSGALRAEPRKETVKSGNSS